MSDVQFQHVIHMLAGLQKCISFVGYAIVAHMLFSGTSNSGIESELRQLREKFKS